MRNEQDKLDLFRKILLDITDELEDVNLKFEDIMKIVYLAGYEEGYSDGQLERIEE